TCVMTPEVTEGPYFVMNELVRQNVRENQRGVPLPLDIGVIDITSCKPLPNAFVEIWHANATGAPKLLFIRPPHLLTLVTRLLF
ncbi:Intradiol ring-cleavage dioxygenase, partial [Cantharellus anzutake]|uniref:Intradiol ring-cleavage dioxygenase n=1 Tax=Cantharellus anzutake TaxID=1750568 RepID=UPI00190640DC